MFFAQYIYGTKYVSRSITFWAVLTFPLFTIFSDRQALKLFNPDPNLPALLSDYEIQIFKCSTSSCNADWSAPPFVLYAGTGQVEPLQHYVACSDYATDPLTKVANHTFAASFPSIVFFLSNRLRA